MIDFKNVSKEYPPSIAKESKVAIHDINFSVSPGEFVILCGRSGAGKTTILKLISCEENPTKGDVFFNEINTRDVKKSEAYKIRQKIGFVFQDFKLLGYKTVYENVAYALEAFNFNSKLVRDEVMQVLELVGLEGKADRLPKELSGGEKQRTSIARALIHRPEIILADEPTGNLDPYHSRDIAKMLLKINDTGSTVILSTHSKDIVNSLKRRVITLEDGRIIRDEEEGVFSL